jgi:hypothetical protein
MLFPGKKDKFVMYWFENLDRIIAYACKSSKVSQDFVDMAKLAQGDDQKSEAAVMLLLFLVNDTITKKRQRGAKNRDTTQLPLSECHKYIFQLFNVSFLNFILTRVCTRPTLSLIKSHALTAGRFDPQPDPIFFPA